MHMYCMLLCTACLCTLCIYSSCIWTISLHTICICNRKQRRPQYKKHRSQRRSGWNHLECSTCNQLRRDIKKENDNNKLLDLKAEFDAHKRRADFAREVYYVTRQKAKNNQRKGDISMIIDAAGGTGTTLIPHFCTTEKKEPQRHEMLGTKCTFVKVHGVGCIIVVSIPELEMQGSNLVFECVLQGIIFFVEETQITDIRNVYIQLDNVNSNKSYSLAACFAAIIYIGICKKVKVSYLEV